ncbi:hypothetical protein BO79DRAFT_253211 [Aspergillus costaricaensis CBS 115574]|uniref:Uncharacterized protein n=1 Tax=Aspergillus costaricaensis CBS 115574 TaxID=1448317 RepID=A0ACD1IIG9_9EURO|nr:hypothetical protein BO79DRAFT_253211 [Aspergillus costaricaensis CBS 115574]RAK90428.1 hypothetical protein BO79DRAFT_253211 [Aspergillus costaricaensis CBS 115574]
MTSQRHGQPTLMDVFQLDRLTCGRDDPTNNQNIDADLDGGGNQTTTLFVDMALGLGWLRWIDIAMMACLAARERTNDEWGNLVRAARLSLVETFTYATDLG